MVGIRIVAFCAVVLLGACGQTGPLVLSDEQSASIESSATSTNAPKTTNNATTPSAE
ncbi:LPS translocon maturation chaperone LptM [Zhongshania aliphaticivorans]|uniref:LPS translocon maturation chaperone LptM n=1 Tax=Zhongshania aliphaticivorans TaxID=1470434 RepID=UPI0012E4EE70|nr:lipoprotein [Zhongshania aliphaticivorans]CAA0118170.1 Uncharacterised protein [Zhongshania aliphaticivorans]